MTESWDDDLPVGGEDPDHPCPRCGAVPMAPGDGSGEDEAIAAVLHDAVEDQGRDGGTLKRIQAAFGDGVASIVEGCSDTDEVPKPPWRARTERYIAGLRNEPIPVLRVSAADKLNNLRAIVRDYRQHGERLEEAATLGLLT